MEYLDETFIHRLNDDLVNLLVLHKSLGYYSAWNNWNSCLDPDGKLKITSSHKRLLDRTNHEIIVLKNQLSKILSESDFNSLIAECSDQKISYQEVTEKKIEMEYRPSDVHFNKDALIDGRIEMEYRPSDSHFNKKALINMTDLNIPDDIQICLSFGYKFLSPYSCNDKNMHSILAQLDQCIDEAIPNLKVLEASIDIYRILSPRSSVQHDDNKNWLAFISHRTKAFFKTNSHVFATKSDKGGHTVVISIPDYESKIHALIDNGGYSLMDHDPLQGLVDEEKGILKILFDLKKKFKWELEGLPKLFEPNTLLLAVFYGLPKIHKDGIPLRPITSTIGSAGYFLAKFFNRMLTFVFPRTEYHIKDTYDFVRFLRGTTTHTEEDTDRNPLQQFVLGNLPDSNGIKLKSDDVLVSFDVVSMFSTIPYDLVFDIIMSKAEKFNRYFKVDRALLERIVSFLLKDCMVFTVLDNIYKQDDGIPMGSCLSPTVARIVMDEVVINLLDRVPQITFIKVFVDDTIVALPKDCIDLALETLNNFRPGQMRFTLERENDHQSINFLNVTLTRNNCSISTNWYRKSFASGRLLNYWSSHKRTTVIATAVHFIRTVLILSDHHHFDSNKPIVFKTLRDNSFPETVIISLMNEYYTYLKPLQKKQVRDETPIAEMNLTPGTPHYFVQPRSQVPPLPTQIQNKIGTADEEEQSGYKIFPHSICEGRRVKEIINKFKAPGVILADSVRNTKINAITTRKTIVPMEKRKNLILISRCKCKKKYKIVKTKINETGEMARSRILTLRKQKCDQHGHAYRKAKFHRGLFYGSQTSYLEKYLAWKYRHALDFDCQIGHPNDRLRKLIKCSCCPRHPQRKRIH